MITYNIANEEEMKILGQKIAKNALFGDIFGIKGTLGAGKSFFASSFINSLLVKKTQILSPTFNLLLSYQSKKGLIHHFDLYRLKDPGELEEIGFFECLTNGICLIEWPEIIENKIQQIVKNYFIIEINIVENNKRIVKVI